MKIKSFLLVLFSLNLFQVEAKKVAFEVDLSNSTVSPNGVHLSGDFQNMIGFGPDWDPASLSMSQLGSGNIYRVVLDLPAFRKYEYRFVNGIHSYEAEFVPEPSRLGWVNGLYSDNRWVYVDSLSNDTLKIGAILFGENAPIGKKLLRFQVDLSDAASIAGSGIHVGTSYQSNPFDPSQIRLYNIRPYEFDIINYVDTGLVNYIFYNGNTSGSTENVPLACQINGKRQVHVQQDTVLPQLCFSSCGNCLTASLGEQINRSEFLRIFPNPATDQIFIDVIGQHKFTISIYGSKGELVKQCAFQSGECEIPLNGMENGVYLIRIMLPNGTNLSRSILVMAE